MDIKTKSCFRKHLNDNRTPRDSAQDLINSYGDIAPETKEALLSAYRTFSDVLANVLDAQGYYIEITPQTLPVWDRYCDALVPLLRAMEKAAVEKEAKAA